EPRIAVNERERGPAVERFQEAVCLEAGDRILEALPERVDVVPAVVVMQLDFAKPVRGETVKLFENLRRLLLARIEPRMPGRPPVAVAMAGGKTSIARRPFADRVDAGAGLEMIHKEEKDVRWLAPGRRGRRHRPSNVRRGKYVVLPNR